MSDAPARPTLTRLALAGGVALAAFGFAAFQSRFPITLGPDWVHLTPFGVGFAAAVLFGFRWSVVPILAGSAAFLAVAGVPTGPAACGLAGVLASAGVAGWWVRRGLPFRPEFDHPQDVLQFALGAAAAAAARGLAVGVAGMALGVPDAVAAGLASASIDWLTVAVIGPGVVLWGRGERPGPVSPRRLGEAVLIGGLVAVQTWVWYGGPSARPLAEPVPALAVLVVFGNWVALRFYTRGMVTLVWVVGGVIAAGSAVRGTFNPVLRLVDPPAEQWAALNGMGVVVLLNLMVAAVARGNRLREVEREDLTRSARKQTDRLKELNERLSLQTLEIADQAAEVQRQRDAFETTARELADKQAQVRLLESAVVHARDAVIVLEAAPCPDRGRSVLYVNDAFTAITGYAPDEAVGRSLHFLRGPKTDPATLDRLRVALDGGTAFAGELLNYRKDGSEVWVDVSLVPVAGPDGGLIHFVMIQRDTTDRKRTEEALRQSEAMFRGFFESTAAGVSLTGPDGRFVSCNPAFAALLGVPVGDVIGRHPREFTHPDDWIDQQVFVRELLAGTRDTYQTRKRYVRDGGAEMWTELSVTAIRGPAGELVYGLGVSVDVTERRKLEEQLRQAQKMEALGQLAGGVAHDFNNLLTAVLGNLALVKTAPDDPHRPLLRTVEQAAGRAADLTRKLLGYARRNQLLIAPVAPADLIGEVVDILHRTLDPRIQIAVDVRTDQPTSADATLINQALINLCLNARDAMPEGGRLTLAADDVVLGPGDVGKAPDARPGAFVRFTVSDTGAGMGEDVVRRLFEPFFTTKGVGRGTGLGLPMVHGIMQQHRGWVTVESAAGKGTRFELYLPAAPAARPASGCGPLPRLDAPAGDDTILDAAPAVETILLVDDEGMIRQLARVVLESAGYTVLEAQDGAEAVDVFRRECDRIDLVILDLTMPRLSGRDAFNLIQGIDPGARVLFSSGYSADDVSEVGGAKGLLSKPYRPADLLAAVRKAVADHPEPVTAGS